MVGNGSTIAFSRGMMRVAAAIVLVFTLVTGCSGQLRKPALVVGGALTLGGIAFTAHSSNRGCDSGELGSDFNCAGEAIGGSVLGMIIAGIGAGLLVGAALGGDDSDEPKQFVPTPEPAPTPIAEAPTSDPSEPPPAMEPEPSQW
jgi:hypothetical protein